MLERWISPLRKRVALMIMKAVVKSIDTATKLPTVTVALLSGEDKPVTLLQAYGMASWPVTGAQGIVLFPGGNREQGLLVSTDNADGRPALDNEGDTALYNKGGCLIKLKDDGIEITAAGGNITIIASGSEVNITTDKFTVNGSNLEVT